MNSNMIGKLCCLKIKPAYSGEPVFVDLDPESVMTVGRIYNSDQLFVVLSACEYGSRRCFKVLLDNGMVGYLIDSYVAEAQWKKS